jgi:hypothetical protein
MSSVNFGGAPVVIANADGLTPSTLRFDGTNAIGANKIGVPLLTQSIDRLCFHVSCPSTGAPNGTFTIQGSNDISSQENNVIPDVNLINWAPVAFFDEAAGANATSRVVAGAATFLLTIQNCGCRWVRVVWTNTSGTALLTIRPQAKSIGGR